MVSKIATKESGSAVQPCDTRPSRAPGLQGSRDADPQGTDPIRLPDVFPGRRMASEGKIK